jgi:hypothetical protein
MSNSSGEVNVVMDILKAMLEYQPGSVFVNSLYQQFCNRGGLSKKQLEGLHSKASKNENIAAGKLATLEAIIKKKPTRYKSTVTQLAPLPEKDETTGELLTAILAKYPLHKRILFLRSKFDNNEPISAAEITEIQKLAKLLL